MEQNPPVSPVFLKLRAWALGIISLLSFIWIILLCVVAYTRFSLSSRPEQTFIVILLLVDVLTVILLPIMLLVRFRSWLDAVRMLTLLICHVGVAAVYSAWVPKMPCSSSNVDETGVCELVNTYTLIATWIIPVLLVVYCCCLALMVNRRKRRLAAEALESKQTSSSPSLISDSQTSAAATTTTTTLSSMSQKPNLTIVVPPPRPYLSRTSSSPVPSTPSVYSSRTSVYAGVVDPEPKSAWSDKTRSSRLSKPIPNWAFAY